MQFDGAHVREQGVEFAIVIVKRAIIQHSIEANKARKQFSRFFPGLPIILMSQDSRGIPTYQGRKDIVNFLANIPMESIPWKTYTIS